MNKMIKFFVSPEKFSKTELPQFCVHLTIGRQCSGMGKTFKKSFEVKILQEMGSRTKY